MSDIGEFDISGLELRQMFCYPNSTIVAHEKMAGLVVTSQRFADFQERRLSEFGRWVGLEFCASAGLVPISRAALQASQIECTGA